MEHIFDTAAEHSADAIVMAGDIFDRKDVRPRERALFVRALLQWTDIPVLGVVGNHDMLEPGLTSLNTVKRFQDAGRLDHVFFAENSPEIVKVGSCVFVLIPYTGDNAGYGKLVRRLVKRAQKEHGRKRRIIVVGHEMIAGSSEDSGRVFRNGVTLPRLDSVFLYLFGDIHKRQKLSGLNNAWYPGSPAQHRFSEKKNKGVLLFDTEQGIKPKFIPTKHRDIKPLVTVEGATAAEIETKLGSTKLSNAWVRIKAPPSVKMRDIKDEYGIVVKDVSVPIVRDDTIERIREADPSEEVGPWLMAFKGFSKKEARMATKIVESWGL